MAQLPPKAPTATSMEPNWVGNNSSWLDEFIDFSAARRMTHRRSVSDTITFMEAGENNGFEGFDEMQFMNMFNDEDVSAPVDPSKPSTSSENNSVEEMKENLRLIGEKKDEKQEPKQKEQQVMIKKECEEVESLCETEETQAPLDPKRVKRILANRQSAQRSRVRKLQYINELERSVTTLQAEVSLLSPRVAFLDHQRLLLNVDNSALKQRIAALAQDKIFKDAAQEALTREIERLRELFHWQQNSLQKMSSPSDSAAGPSEIQASQQPAPPQGLTSF